MTLYHGPRIQQDIFLFDLVRGGYDALTTDPHNDFHPLFSPDGRQIAFGSTRGGQLDLYVSPADKSSPAELLFENEYAKWATGWSPDSALLAFRQEHPETGWDVWIHSLGQSEAQPFLAEPFNELEAVFSPDGRWLAYQSDEAGQPEVYVVPYPGPGPRCKVSTTGGLDPRWGPDGTELFFRARGVAMVADVADENFCDTQAAALFEGLDEKWNVSPTGDFFITVAPREPPKMNLVLNWTEELKRLVPID